MYILKLEYLFVHDSEDIHIYSVDFSNMEVLAYR